MVVAVVMAMVDEEDVVGGAMVRTHMNFQQAQNIRGRSFCLTSRPMKIPIL